MKGICVVLLTIAAFAVVTLVLYYLEVKGICAILFTIAAFVVVTLVSYDLRLYKGRKKGFVEGKIWRKG